MINLKKSFVILYPMNELPNPDLVVFKNVLRKNKIESDIGDIIVKKICLLGSDLKKHKFDTEFLLYACNLIEHLVGSNKTDKKKLAISILNSIFTLNLNEIEVLSSLIEFLHSNQLIKKIEQKIEATILTKVNTIFNVGEKSSA